MTRSELITTLKAKFPGLTVQDVEDAVKALIHAVSDTVAGGGRVEIRGFGVFYRSYRPPRTGRNPKNGDSVAVPAKATPRFKPGKELRQCVDFDAAEKQKSPVEANGGR